MRHVLKGPSEVSQPRMTFAKNLLITWCLETQGANSRLFSTWWMRSPLCSPNHICSCLTERKCGPCPFSASLSHGNGFSVSSLSLFSPPPSLAHTHTYVHSAVGKGQGWSAQRRMLTSENSLTKLQASICLFERLLIRKQGGPRPEVSFLSLF